MSFNDFKMNKIYKNQLHQNFNTINNLTIDELRKFINLVTIHANTRSGILLQDENTLERLNLFLLDTNGSYTKIELFFSLNILIYLGDLYQKKSLPPFVSYDEINRNDNLHDRPRLSWLLQQGFRTEIRHPETNQLIELNWGTENFNESLLNIKRNPSTSEINYEKYIEALYFIFEKLENDRIDTPSTDLDLLTFLSYATLDIGSDDIIISDIIDSVNKTKIKITRQNIGVNQIDNVENNNLDGFIGWRQIDKLKKNKNNKKKFITEGFSNINNYSVQYDELINNNKREIDNKKLIDNNILRLYDEIPEILTINNIAKNIIKQTISIDSRHRKNYYQNLSTAYSLDLPECQKNVVEMSIVAVEMPMTFYSISEYLGNNTMLIISDSSFNNSSQPLIDLSYVNLNNNIINFQPSNMAWRVKLEEGNYDTKSWLTDKFFIEQTMNRALNLATPGALNNNGTFAAFESPNDNDFLNSNFDGTKDIRYTINKINGKSVFSTPIPNDYDKNVTYDFNTKKITKIRFNVDNDGNLDTNTSIQKRMGWAIGFRAAEYNLVTSIINNLPFSAVSEGVGFISAIRYGFLSIEEYQNNSHPSLIVAYNDYIIDKKIMTRLCLAPLRLNHDLSSRETGFISHRRTPRNYFKPVNIDKLTIKLFDEYGRIIDLNNMDWSITIEFKKLY